MPHPNLAPTPTATPQAAVGTTRVLIVDDEIAMRALTCAIIEDLGFEAIAVSNGESAIDVFKAKASEGTPISAVIMDLALPGGMSGLEATDHLTSFDASIPVIASSGYLQQNARSAAIERGFAGILPKPYTKERLTAELRWVLAQRRQDQA